MEAPKEIWLLPDIEMPDGLSILWYEAPYCTGAIKYTHTDAFIEKACEFLNDRIKHDSIDYPMATVHLIDDFKNYMKGG